MSTPISLKPDTAKTLTHALGLGDHAKPFSWQLALLESFLRGSSELPNGVDVPTGLGKTAVMAIWLVARAFGAVLPRRLIYIVDRRVVVDQATAEAERLRHFVETTPHLRSQLGLSKSLPISTLRGQHLDNREWMEDPSVPAIVVGTVDMIGSRLLFEGYGVSRKMRPYHAGLLGVDSLVVLDEAHLVPPFEALLESMACPSSGFQPKDGDSARTPDFHVLTLSATGKNKAKVQGLTSDDLAEGTESRKRLDARKTIKFETPDKESDFPNWIAEKAWELSKSGNGPQRVLVFCNLRRVAESVAKAIKSHARDEKIEIYCEPLVGARRVRERQLAAERLKEHGWFSGAAKRPDKPTFLVATSAGEVGVDLDADHMVCDLVEWERMIQRFGRVNRRGDGDSQVHVLLEKEPEPNAKEKAALEKAASDRDDKEVKLVRSFNEKIARARKLRAPFDLLPLVRDGRDASPLALRNLRDQSQQIDDPEAEKITTILRAASTAPPLRPALSRPLVEAWSMTSLKEHTGRPEITPWLRGWTEGEPPQTRVVWRSNLPVFPFPNGQAFPEQMVARYFEAAPIHISEVLETTTSEVFDWLQRRAAAMGRLDGTKRPLNSGACIGFLLESSGEPTGGPLLLDQLTSDEGDKTSKETLKRKLGHRTVVLDAHFGGLAETGLLDASEKDSAVCIDGPGPWLDDTPAAPIVPFRIVRSPIFDKGWLPTAKFPLNDSEDGPATEFLFIYKWRTGSGDADDQSVSGEQSLRDHQALAEQKMREISDRLGLDSRLSELLCLAARIHDEGKNSTRWQDAFNAPSEGRPYAKTEGPISQRKLSGYRHELVSMLRAKEHPEVTKLPTEEFDLLLHLIAAHHGFARPFIGLNGCDDSPPSKLKAEAVEIARRFARLQKRWGPWGLAWLESLLRAADQQASRCIDTNPPSNLESFL